MTTKKIRYMEDALYRTSDSHFFKLPEELRSDLDIPAFMRLGIPIKNKKTPALERRGKTQKGKT
jgi:hypothetical protein